MALVRITVVLDSTSLPHYAMSHKPLLELQGKPLHAHVLSNVDGQGTLRSKVLFVRPKNA